MIKDNILTTFEIAGVEFFVRISYELIPKSNLEPEKIQVTSLAIPKGNEGQIDLSELLASPELHQAIVEIIEDAKTPTDPDDDPWRKAFVDARGF